MFLLQLPHHHIHFFCDGGWGEAEIEKWFFSRKKSFSPLLSLLKFSICTNRKEMVYLLRNYPFSACYLLYSCYHKVSISFKKLSSPLDRYHFEIFKILVRNQNRLIRILIIIDCCPKWVKLQFFITSKKLYYQTLKKFNIF